MDAKKRKAALTVVKLDLPFCIYLSDGVYQIKTEKGIGKIVLKRKARYSKPEDLPWSKGGIVLGIDPEHCELVGDRFGLVAFTEVILNIPEDLLSDEDMLKERVVFYINRLMEIYRSVTGDFWVQTISPSDLVSIQTRFLDEKGNDIPDLAYYMPRMIKSGEETIRRSEQIHNQIRQILIQDFRIPAYNQLMLDSLSNLQFGKYALSVILSQTAFENFFLIFTKWKLEQIDQWNSEMEERLYGERAHLRGEGGILEYFSPKITDPPKSFAKGVKEYDEWYDKSYRLRSAIIHHGKVDITSQEASDAFKAVEDAFHFFGQDWRRPFS